MRGRRRGEGEGALEGVAGSRIAVSGSGVGDLGVGVESMETPKRARLAER